MFLKSLAIGITAPWSWKNKIACDFYLWKTWDWSRRTLCVTNSLICYYCLSLLFQHDTIYAGYKGRLLASPTHQSPETTFEKKGDRSISTWSRRSWEVNKIACLSPWGGCLLHWLCVPWMLYVVDLHHRSIAVVSVLSHQWGSDEMSVFREQIDIEYWEQTLFIIMSFWAVYTVCVCHPAFQDVSQGIWLRLKTVGNFRGKFFLQFSRDWGCLQLPREFRSLKERKN